MSTIWWKMIDDQKELLAVFKVRIHDLMKLCDEQKSQIKDLKADIQLKEGQLEQSRGRIEELSARCNDIVTARVVSANESEIKSARNRLSALVREVDKCIALLNE